MEEVLQEQPIPTTNTHRVCKVLPFVICFLASFFYVYEFFLRVVPSAITHELMRDFNINAGQLSFMSAFFYYAYTPMQVPAGILLDRFGARKLLSISMLLCGLGAILFGFTTRNYMFVVSRFAIGFASSFAFVGALVLAARWFPPKYFALITGLIQLMGCIGAIAGEAPVAILTNYIGWQQLMIWSGVVGIVIAVLFWLIIRNGPNKIDSHAHLEFNEKASGLWQNLSNELNRLLYVCKNSQTWLVGICSFCCWAPVVIFASLWGISFLMVDYNISATAASVGSTFVWLGLGITSPIIGWWSNAIQSRRIPLIISFLVAIVTSLVVIYIPHPSWILMNFMLFFFGAAASAQSITFGLVQDNNPISVEGTAMGFNNMAIIFGGVVMQPMTGWLLNLCWSGKMVNGAPFYSMACYEKALVLIPICGVVGLITAIFFLKETHCRPQFSSELPSSISNANYSEIS